MNAGARRCGKGPVSRLNFLSISFISGNCRLFWNVKISIDLRLQRGQCAALKRLARDVWGEPQGPTCSTLTDEAEIAKALAEEHRLDFYAEYELVDRLLTDAAFEQGSVELDEAEAGCLLRAASAIRLALRSKALKAIPDSALEAGAVSPWLTDPDQARAYWGYVVFAALQEAVIHGLDPSLYQGLLPPEDEEL